MAIRVERLVKTFPNGTRAVDDVTFEVRSGELVSLLGPSGSGKSTILRVIAGLEAAESGSVWLDGEQVDHLHAREREIGFVFQNYALFRHMTVGENVAFGLSVRKAPREVQQRRVAELLELMGLAGLEHRYPAQLSGGQRQRVALARALAPEPRLLLLDEPFGAVDAKVREELRRWLRRLHDEVHTTSILVTHDQQEAFAVSDRVLIVHQGRLEQVGTPEEILDAPATEFVSRFIGDVNVFDGEVRGGRGWVGPVPTPPVDLPDGPARIVVRAHDLVIERSNDRAVATVDRVTLLGDRVRIDARLDHGGVALFAQCPRTNPAVRDLEAGARIAVVITAARAWQAAVAG